MRGYIPKIFVIGNINFSHFRNSRIVRNITLSTRRPCPPFRERQGIAALDRLRSQERGAEVLASVHPLDVTNPQSVDRFQRSCVRDYLGGKVDILFNNAGVCLQGQGHAVLESTLGVNFFGALRVIEACLPALKGMNPSVLACDVPVRQDLGSATVVWITSGDGELCFLGSKWQAILEQASCVEVGKSYTICDVGTWRTLRLTTQSFA